MMTRKNRRTFTADEKLNAVRRHLIDKIPVSDLCDKLGLQPTQIYQWQKLLFDNGGSAFDKPGHESSATTAHSSFHATSKSSFAWRE
jgi:transposase-like protein